MTIGGEFSTNYSAEPEVQQDVQRCLRCKSTSTISLDKASQSANTCYLCRGCGHIFSPALSVAQKA